MTFQGIFYPSRQNLHETHKWGAKRSTCLNLNFHFDTAKVIIILAFLTIFSPSPPLFLYSPDYCQKSRLKTVFLFWLYSDYCELMPVIIVLHFIFDFHIFYAKFLQNSYRQFLS